MAALLLWASPEARAQQPRPEPAARDTVRADTVPGDSLAADSARAAPTDAATDSVLSALRRLPGYTATEYQGTNAVYRADEGVLRLQGEAGVERAGDRLAADTIVFRDRTDLVEAYGSPTVSGQQQELSGNVLYYDLARKRATALGARTKVTQGATWHVTGDVTLEGSERVYASHGQFTTCDLEIPHYHFESDKIKIVKDKYLVARPARLYFGNVPVMVLPFVVQNLERGRRSGLVVPKFSINDIVRTNSGYTRQISDIGWYWAINEYLGAQLTGTWRSEAYTSLNAHLDWRWRRQFLDGRVTFQRYWRDTGQKELNLNAGGSWQPDERTRLNFQGQYASSSDFVRRSTADPREATQELRSTLSSSRQFDWGSVSFGATRAQSIADGSVSGTLPSLSISPKAITLFRARSPEQAEWYSNATLQWGFTGTRQFSDGKGDFARGVQDRSVTQLQGGLQQFSVGNLRMNLTGNLNQTVLHEVLEETGAGIPLHLPRANQDRGGWQASIGYQQQLIGQTSFTPNVALRQEIIRDTLTGGEYLGGPMRVDFGASVSSALFGFYPGVGPFSRIRHRLSPSLSYSYAPQTELTDVQRRAFGEVGGRAQNRLTLGFNQTWEAKLKPREVERRDPVEVPPEVGEDSARVDSATAAAAAQQPTDERKVTLLALNTSALQYDFVQAAEEGNGFVTSRISNSVSSDYLQGLTIQMEHELFDRRNVDREARGELGTFSPRLSSLSTAFQLGPNSGVVRWLEGLFGGLGGTDDSPTQGVMAGEPPTDDKVADRSLPATGNPQGTGAGPWRMGLRYSFTQPSRTPGLRDDGSIQTLGIDTNFALTPNWAVTWNTDYSITDGEFGTHRLNFRRDLHRWQANFSFYKTPNGNSAFEFYVELIDNRELKVDYRERNLGIDRR